MEEERPMDLQRHLKTAANTGRLTYGHRQAAAACARGEAKLLILAANCPPQRIEALQASHPDVPKHRVGIVNRDLGAVCAKPFSVSVLCVLDPGQSELLSLRDNLA